VTNESWAACSRKFARVFVAIGSPLGSNLYPEKWKLKKAIQIVNQTLNELKVEKHPDKTFIGRIAKGFDF
jgi:hypothetical protein